MAVIDSQAGDSFIKQFYVFLLNLLLSFAIATLMNRHANVFVIVAAILTYEVKNHSLLHSSIA